MQCQWMLTAQSSIHHLPSTFPYIHLIVDVSTPKQTAVYVQYLLCTLPVGGVDEQFCGKCPEMMKIVGIPDIPGILGNIVNKPYYQLRAHLNVKRCQGTHLPPCSLGEMRRDIHLGLSQSQSHILRISVEKLSRGGKSSVIYLQVASV